MRWTGRILSGLAITFLLWDGVIKLMRIDPVLESFTRLGYPARLAVGLGLLELACVAFHLVPRTTIVGAILLTGYLGGAVATYLRVGDPLLSHVLFPAYVGALVWGGLILGDARLRTLAAELVRPAHATRRKGDAVAFVEAGSTYR